MSFTNGLQLTLLNYIQNARLVIDHYDLDSLRLSPYFKNENENEIFKSMLKTYEKNPMAWIKPLDHKYQYQLENLFIWG